MIRNFTKSFSFDSTDYRTQYTIALICEFREAKLQQGRTFLRDERVYRLLAAKNSARWRRGDASCLKKKGKKKNFSLLDVK